MVKIVLVILIILHFHYLIFFIFRNWSIFREYKVLTEIHFFWTRFKKIMFSKLGERIKYER